MRLRTILLVLALVAVPVAIQACAAAAPPTAGGGARAKPVPTLNHAVHLSRDLLCIDCHDPDETGTPVIPKAELCFECHENLDEENERVQAYFKAVRQADGTYRFPASRYTADLNVAHKTHGAKEVDCASCHGKASDKGFVRAPLFELKGRCLSCHEERGGSLECATCHRELRADQKPATHDASWLGAHGATAPDGWRGGAQASCTFCHSMPNDCNACHENTKPQSHLSASWADLHGRGESDARDARFQDTSCSLCHKENACIVCHQTTKPRSHTAPFVRRLHGIVASVDRTSCLTCHKQDYCNRCHEVVEPLNHRGSWSTGRQTHCIQCHEPLSSSSCSACHKNTLAHALAPPPPADATHATATTCLNCHLVLPHLEDGDGNRCRRCHR